MHFTEVVLIWFLTVVVVTLKAITSTNNVCFGIDLVYLAFSISSP